MNYVLFYPDEMRAESLSVYGHPLIRTPNYERIAREGTVFEQNYTPNPVCAPSRCALATGWYPHVQGYRTLRYKIDESKPNFFYDLKNAGYRTCLAGKNHCFNQTATRLSFDQVTAFEENDTRRVYKHVIEKKSIKPYSMLYAPLPDHEADEIPDYQFVEEGIQFIREMKNEEKPFFVFFSLNNPHCPYTVPETYYNLYDPDELPPLRDLSWLEGKPEMYQLIRTYRKCGGSDEWIARKINAVYLGMITYTDMLLGKVIDVLEELDLYNQTTIILCSDHGDFAGDVGLPEKWPSAMDDMLTRVPLIIRRPGCKKGHRVTQLTQSFDIFPTICDFEQIQILHDQFGLSLRSQVEGASGDSKRRVYCEGGYDTREPHCFEGTNVEPYITLMKPGTDYYPKLMQQQNHPESVCRTVMQRDNRYKLTIRTNGENELYDMKNDRMEYHNLYNDQAYREMVHEKTYEMLTWLIHTSDVVPREGHV